MAKKDLEKAWNEYEERRAARKPWAYQRRQVRAALRAMKRAGVTAAG